MSLNDETESQIKARTKEHSKILKDHFNNDGSITVYRGVNSGSFIDDLALSYTVDKTIAEWFANRFSFKGGVNVIKKDVHIEDILLYTNERNEQEVILQPPIFNKQDIYKELTKEPDLIYKQEG